MNKMDGQPCEHKSCLSHISHPCEGCGRIGGIRGNVRQKEINRLQEIRDRLNNATTGPWEQDQSNVTIKGRTLFFTYMANHKDAEFVAHARQDVLYLLDALEQAQEALNYIINSNTTGVSRLNYYSLDIAKKALGQEATNG